MARWERKASRRIGLHPVFEVWEHDYLKDGEPVPRPLQTFATADWCNVVPLTTDDRVVMVRQHRFGIDAPSLEIPGGLIDPGEAPLEAARRELREETAYEAESIVPLGVVFANPARQSTRLHMFLARGCRPHGGAQKLEELEDCEVVLVGRDEIDALVERGEIHHALVWSALFAWRRLEPR
jgi:ADP-ribose pyrophosphatase